MSLALGALAALAVLVGALLQRLTGIGFSLIVAPSLAVAIGPTAGVETTNLLTLIVAVAVFAASARQVDTARTLLLVPSGLIGVLPGLALATWLPSGPLQITVGAVTGLGLVAVLCASRLRLRPSRTVTICSGLASGFTTSTAGAGGPSLTVYAIATGWSQQEFITSGQVCYASQAALALAIRGLPRLPAAWLGTAVVAIAVGLAIGTYLAVRITGSAARRAAGALAALASLAVVIKGIFS